MFKWVILEGFLAKSYCPKVFFCNFGKNNI
jgi:hypothetical protein